MEKTKKYIEFLVKSEFLDDTIRHITDEGWEVEQCLPAKEQWVAQLISPGIAHMAAAMKDVMYFDVVISRQVSAEEELEEWIYILDSLL